MLNQINEIFRGISCMAIGSLIHVTPSPSMMGVKLIQNPVNYEATALVIQGGAINMGHVDSYTKILALLCPRLKIYILCSDKPTINMNMADDVRAAFKVITKHTNRRPYILIGFSMGGILTWSYLSKGYTDFDLYIPISAPIDIFQFDKDIHKYPLFNYLRKTAMKKFKVKTEEELFEKAGLSMDQKILQMNQLKEGLIKNRPSWINKTIVIGGTDDTLLRHYARDLKVYDGISTLMIDGATHCCIDVVVYASIIIKAFLKKSDVQSILRDIRCSTP